MDKRRTEGQDNVWQSFKKSTTAHGIPHVSNAKGTSKKSFWALICVIMISTMVFHLYRLFSNYLEYKVNVHVRMHPMYQVEFPAVTVCNINPVRSSQLYKSEKLSSLFGNTGNSNRKKRDVNVKMNKDNLSILESAGNVHNFVDDHDVQIGTNRSNTRNSREKRSSSSDPNDVLIYYDNANKTGPYLIVDGDDPIDLPAEWDNRASAIYIAGPSYWKISVYSGLAWSFIRCPGEYVYGDGTLTYDNVVSSQQRMDGPLCDTVPVETATNYTVDNSTSCWVVNYTCIDGYHFEDNSQYNIKYCSGKSFISSSGQWKGDVPPCRKDSLEMTTYMTTDDVYGTNTIESQANKTETISVSNKEETSMYTEETIMNTEETSMYTEETIMNTEETIMNTEETSTSSSFIRDSVSNFISSTDTPTKFTDLTESLPNGSSVKGLSTTLPTLVDGNVSETNILDDIPKSSFTEKKRDDYLIQELTLETLSNIPEETKKEMGYQRSDLVIDCSYEGEDCTSELSFDFFYHTELGNCYIFNSGWNASKPVKKAYRMGQRHGLQLVMNVNQSEYMNTIPGPAGARVVIHSQNTMPYPTDEGILARPGEIISIGIKRVDYTRKSQPYGNCTTKINSQLADVYSKTHPVQYSTYGCIKTCYQKELIKHCGCGNSQYPLKGESLGGQTQGCSMYDPTQIECQEKYDLTFAQGKIECYCPQRCSETTFHSEVSTAQWPAELHMDLLVKNLEKQNIIFTEPGDAVKHILKVDVFYRDLNVEENIELPDYSESQLVSDLGGAFGLWFGLSVITIMEFMEFFIDVFIIGLSQCCRTKQINDQKRTNTHDQDLVKEPEKGLLPHPQIIPGHEPIITKHLHTTNKSKPSQKCYVKRIQTLHS